MIFTGRPSAPDEHLVQGGTRENGRDTHAASRPFFMQSRLTYALSLFTGKSTGMGACSTLVKVSLLSPSALGS